MTLIIKLREILPERMVQQTQQPNIDDKFAKTENYKARTTKQQEEERRPGNQALHVTWNETNIEHETVQPHKLKSRKAHKSWRRTAKFERALQQVAFMKVFTKQGMSLAVFRSLKKE